LPSYRFKRLDPCAWRSPAPEEIAIGGVIASTLFLQEHGDGDPGSIGMSVTTDAGAPDVGRFLLLSAMAMPSIPEQGQRAMAQRMTRRSTENTVE